MISQADEMPDSNPGQQFDSLVHYTMEPPNPKLQQICNKVPLWDKNAFKSYATVLYLSGKRYSNLMGYTSIGKYFCEL